MRAKRRLYVRGNQISRGQDADFGCRSAGENLVRRHLETALRRLVTRVSLLGSNMLGIVAKNVIAVRGRKCN